MSDQPAVSDVDIAVVGGGAAGCVLAARLSERPDRTVALIEAGPDYPDPEALPEDLRSGWRSAGSHDWGLTDEATGAVVARAKVVGGCSATNGTIALRGASADFDGWAALGNPGWSFAQVLPDFRRIETDLDFSDDWHGQHGPVPIRRYGPKELTAVNAAAYEALVEAGFAEVTDHNRPGAIGVGPAPVNTVGGVRMSAAATYLRQARDRPNLSILADATADRVLLERGTATGVRLADGRIVRAGRVVLAAGTYGSPAILLRTGIGPAHDLAVLGLPCRSDLPGVGANLQEHPGISVIWPLARELPDGPRFQIVATQAAPGHTAGDGPWLQHVPAATPTLFWVSATVMNPRSRGRVRLATLDPLARPRITLNLLAELEDLAAMVEGVRSARHVGARGPLKELAGGPEQWLGAGIQDPAELADALRRAVWTYHHACGTCAMGPDPQTGSVVDAQGRVYGVDNLWVADASIMPVIPSANTHLPTLMIAEHLAGQIAAAD
ncbi:GMC family oxidoreductase N-terminal domain-containing protein [Actinospica durhamensis]|uniref:GMC family oxidoreductase N-terminal domain-containing protein n=1 Tax=Actinospica durhamensis TaxID=1508375 RepID=A0A941EK06_9ACTN|nr:GMC oxidoreductase [Actinospica durhamensis]MBR7832268.1 GMC family oxidoreductase N-terminal domain-containing protein [Actinospica durhamensis]